MRLLAGIIAASLLVACSGSSSSENFHGLDPNMKLTRSDGSTVTVRQQFKHIHALIKDSGYSFICGTLMTAEADPPEGDQTKQDADTLHAIHVSACQDEANR